MPLTSAQKQIKEAEAAHRKEKKRRARQAFLRALHAVGLPMPRTEYRFHPVRRWRNDYAWPAHCVALEIEGGVWKQGRHTRGSGFVKDMEKYNALANMGYRLIRCQPADLCKPETMRLIRDALTAAN